MLLQVVF